MKIIKAVVLVVAIMLLGFALFMQAERMLSLTQENKSSALSGTAVNEASSVDRLMRRDGNLYDTRTVKTPNSISGNDCPT